MDQLLKVKAKETGVTLLDVKFDNAPGQTLNFEVVVRMDGNNLRGEIAEEQYVMLAVLYERLGYVLENHSRKQSND